MSQREREKGSDPPVGRYRACAASCWPGGGHWDLSSSITNALAIEYNNCMSAIRVRKQYPKIIYKLFNDDMWRFHQLFPTRFAKHSLRFTITGIRLGFLSMLRGPGHTLPMVLIVRIWRDKLSARRSIF